MEKGFSMGEKKKPQVQKAEHNAGVI